MNLTDESTKGNTPNIPKWLKRRNWHLIIAIIASVLMLSLIVCLIVFCINYTREDDYSSADVIAIILNALVAAFGFYAISASLQNDKKAKEFEFYAQYNFNFLTNPDFKKVERKLESCYQEYKRLLTDPIKGEWNEDKEKKFTDYCDQVFGTKNFKYIEKESSGEQHVTQDQNSLKDKYYKNLISKDYLNIINYLVYLEAFVALLKNKQFQYKDVDDLYGYRFFIAINNPVLQENELFPDFMYYNGCFDVYDEWKEYREKEYMKQKKKKEKEEIPILDNNIPMANYDLLKRFKKRIRQAKQLAQ